MYIRSASAAMTRIFPKRKWHIIERQNGTATETVCGAVIHEAETAKTAKDICPACKKVQ